MILDIIKLKIEKFFHLLLVFIVIFIFIFIGSVSGTYSVELVECRSSLHRSLYSHSRRYVAAPKTHSTNSFFVLFVKSHKILIRFSFSSSVLIVVALSVVVDFDVLFIFIWLCCFCCNFYSYLFWENTNRVALNTWFVSLSFFIYSGWKERREKKRCFTIGHYVMALMLLSTVFSVFLFLWFYVLMHLGFI